MEKDVSQDTKPNFLEAIGELLPASIFAKGADGKYAYYNSVFANSVGINNPYEGLNKTAREVLEPERAHNAEKEDHLVLKEGKSIINRENFDKRIGREDRWSLVSKVPVKNESGEIVGLVGMALDIHARKMAEEKLHALAHELERRNEKLEADLTLARTIQRAMLPNQEEGDEDASGLSIAYRVNHSERLGGDFVNITEPQPGTRLVLICDVMGHGIQAALIAFLLNGLIDSLSREVADPGHFLTALNERFCAITGNTSELTFATALCVSIDALSQTCSYASAGHPLPLVAHPGGAWQEPGKGSEEQGQCALGIVQDAVYETDSFPFEKEATLALFTDGIIESLAESGEEIGQRGLVEALRGSAGRSPQSILETVQQNIAKAHIASQDDVTLLIAKNQ